MSKTRGRVLGVAGYMGSGKTTVAECLRGGMASVIEADAVAKELMNTDETIRRELGKAFGEDVLEEGKVLFDRLGTRAYASLDSMGRLNAIVHPPLLAVLSERLRSDAAFPCVLDAALIPYWHIEDWFDVLCWVDAPFGVRLARLCKKLALTREELERRMRLQEEMFGCPRRSPWIHIDNSGSVEALERSLRHGRHEGLRGMVSAGEGMAL